MPTAARATRTASARTMPGVALEGRPHDVERRELRHPDARYAGAREEPAAEDPRRAPFPRGHGTGRAEHRLDAARAGGDASYGRAGGGPVDPPPASCETLRPAHGAKAISPVLNESRSRKSCR